jgi:hypothetical protein
MLAIAERRARPKAERFYRPFRDGRLFLHHFPALRTRLLSPNPSGTSPSQATLRPPASRLDPKQSAQLVSQQRSSMFER